MKILNYIIFISTLSSLFLLVYRQSDKTGFRRWSMSFKTAAFIAVILAGLIPNPVKEIELDVPNNWPSIEIILSNQELDSLDDPNSRVILVKTGDILPSVPTSPGRGEPTNFPSGTTGGRRTPHVNPYKTLPKLVDQGLGAAPNPAGAGGAAEFDDNSPVLNKEQSQESKTFDYDYRSNDSQKKNKSKDQCPIDEQNKAGINELPDSSEFIYNLETKTARKALKKVWKNTEAKKEVLAGLDRMNSGKLLPRNQKNFKGFKTLKELKFTKTRMLVQPRINGGPDQIVAIFMRRDLDNIASIFKGKYK